MSGHFRNFTHLMKVLFIRFSSFGDIVLTTPVVRCVKQQLGAEVHFLVKEKYAAALESNPYIDRVITIANDIDEVRSELQAMQYDWIADLHHNLRSWRLRMSLRRPGAEFPKLNFAKWMLTNFKVNLLPDIHIVERYFQTVADLDVQNDGKGLDFFIASKDEVDLSPFGHLNSRQFVAAAIGAGLPTKNLEWEQWKSLLEMIPLPIVLLGGQEDAERGQRLAQAIPGVINLAGTLTLAQSASVIRQSAVLISPDTGLMHIGAALNKPVVSIWGNTVPEFGMYPYNPTEKQSNVMFEVKGLSCRPCSKIGFVKCPKGHFRCMREQPLQSIANTIRSLCEKENRGYPGKEITSATS
jgi:ADP-heptose:LPS heptosyltransferase